MFSKRFTHLQHAVPKQLLTAIAGRLGTVEVPFIKDWLIRKFMHQYPVNLQEAVITNPKKFSSFNHFFTRELKPSMRPISHGAETLVCPVDGRVSAVGAIETRHLLQAKSMYYSLEELLANDRQMYEQYLGGDYVTLYLAPHDYHRVHLPFAGTLAKTIYVPGTFFSVNEASVNRVPELFLRNERLIAEFYCEFSNLRFSMLVIMVGAMIVSGIETVWGGRIKRKPKTRIQGFGDQTIHLEKAQEMGRFNLGSTVILIFPKGCVTWAPSLRPGTPVRVGRTLGQLSIDWRMASKAVADTQ